MKRKGFLARCLLGFAVAAFSVPLAIAQGQGGGQGGGGTGGGGGGGNIPGGGGGQPGGRGETGIPQQQRDPFPQQQQQFPEFRRPIFLQGKVIFEDGTPAPPSVVIERVCGGRPIPEDYTDSKGRFSFQVGQNQQMVSDASYSGADNFPGAPRQNTGGFGQMGGGFPGSGGEISERDLMGCELRAQLPGYRSTSVELTGRRMFDNPDVGTLILSKIAGVEGLTISMTTLHAPKKAQKAYERGVKEAQKNKLDKAETELNKAVTEYPEYALAWQTLGQVYEAQNKPAEARDAYAKALSADGKFISPYIRLALMDAREQKWQDVADTTNRVLKMNPFDFPDAYFYNSVANLNLNQLSAAEKSAREAIKLNAHQKFPQVENVLGLALAQQGNFVEAKQHLERYLEILPEAGNAETVRSQITQLEAAVAQQQPQAQAQPQQ